MYNVYNMYNITVKSYNVSSMYNITVKSNPNQTLSAPTCSEQITKWPKLLARANRRIRSDQSHYHKSECHINVSQRHGYSTPTASYIDIPYISNGLNKILLLNFFLKKIASCRYFEYSKQIFEIQNYQNMYLNIFNFSEKYSNIYFSILVQN